MKKRLLILAVIFFVFSPMLYSCKQDNNNSEKCIDFIKNIKSYKCDAVITLLNDRQNLEYNCKQFFKKDLGGRIDLEKDRILLYKDDKIYINDKNSGFKYTIDRDFDTIFRMSLVGEYIHLMYTNEEIKKSLKNIDGLEYQIVELDIPGMNRNISRGKMYINTKDCLPEKLILYDGSNKEKATIKYKQFTANLELEDKLFDVGKKGGE
ncbi:germination lipoprotein GerS-related protein [Clostridium rectalis]|uniref:germination lipoprotein GerS-related protein n=1 Tax=Clostridium rectalis TaxID=2040295 RepID=UPI000F63B145|nr:germination lipoprotein GerS-related protein [Clostridium rectalis]